ncbi:hypothetical protein GCM10023215_32580 [Pseudonocardia yuanmonensis]|uniref:Uncharacterized protein n=1 Tax=Pseudonocardia yuanmonensis TaxID=1095914 RepID=A0ABP8WNV0_9PSEU
MVSGNLRSLTRRLGPPAAVAGAALLVRGCLALTVDAAMAAVVGLVVGTPPVAVWCLQAGPRRSAGDVVRIVAATGSAIVALVLVARGVLVTVHAGVGGLLATAALALVLGLVLGAVRRWRPVPPVGARRPATHTVPLAELCRQWRLSCGHLQRAGSPAELDLVASLRAAYLDEFERRDPEGFRCWTRHDTAARSDPSGWLRERRADDPAG